MGPEISLDMSGQRLEVSIDPAQYYGPAVLTIDVGITTLLIAADAEQLAEIHEALGRHLEIHRNHETPDQQRILNAEHDRVIEEGCI